MKGSLLTLSVLLACLGGHEGRLTVYRLPRFPAVYVGDDVTLNCRGTDQPIKWYINTDEIPHHADPFMLLTAVTSEHSGNYSCEQNGERSEPYTLTVLMLEPLAQLSSPTDGPVMVRGEAKILTLRVDDEPADWKCFAFRNNSGFRLQIMVDVELKTASLYAELKEAQSATFWCLQKSTKHRSNAVTLTMTERLVMLEPPAAPALWGESVTLRCSVWGGAKVEQADFYKDQELISTEKTDMYIIENATRSNEGRYRCIATYRYSHISSEAVQITAGSDTQPLKVIDGPPGAVLSVNSKSLECSCSECSNCSSFYWYHTDESNIRRRLSETSPVLKAEAAGRYTCRAQCKAGFSRFSQEYNHTGWASGGGGTLGVILAACLIVLGVLVLLLVALKCRRYRGNRMLEISQDKNKNKGQSGGDYEQIGLTDNAVYSTLSEATDQTQTEGHYEPLKKTDEAKGVYHTLSQGQSPSEGQGEYEVLPNVKVQVYQTLSSEESKKAEGESEAEYEQLPEKTGGKSI